MAEVDERALEDIMDKSSLEKVLESLANICYEKAEHLRENWQDYTAAKIWDKAAHVVDRAAANVPVYPGIK